MRTILQLLCIVQGLHSNRIPIQIEYLFSSPPKTTIRKVSTNPLCKAVIVNHLDCCDPSQILGSEKARLRALSLTVIRSVVEQHRGHILGDQISESIDISVPEGEEAICAEEIGEQMGLICHHIYSQVDALFKGEVLIQFAEN